MSRLIIVGASGHGKVVADAALQQNRWSDILFTDDSERQSWNGIPVVGPSRLAVDQFRGDDQVVVAIGEASSRLSLLSWYKESGVDLAVIVHPSAAVSPTAQLGPGVVVMAQAAINPDVSIEQGVIVNTGATIDHDCQIGAGSHICPGANLAGDVKTGERAWIGIGAAVKQGVHIGTDAVVGAGAVVVDDVPDNTTVMGVPARSKQEGEH